MSRSRSYRKTELGRRILLKNHFETNSREIRNRYLKAALAFDKHRSALAADKNKHFEILSNIYANLAQEIPYGYDYHSYRIALRTNLCTLMQIVDQIEIFVESQLMIYASALCTKFVATTEEIDENTTSSSQEFNAADDDTKKLRECVSELITELEKIAAELDVYLSEQIILNY